jgi:hypothetical protein
MPTFAVTGNDTLVLNGNVFNDLATDDVSMITFPNELVNIKTGKNGNSLIALSQQGYNANLVVKVSRGSSDDQFLNNILAGMSSNFVGTPLIVGSFTKMMGDGQGNTLSDVYTLAGGVISKIPEGKENTSGDTLQAETVYNIKFTNAGRSIE